MFGTVVLSQLVYNEEYQRKIQPYLQADYFETAGEKTIFGFVDSFVSDYNKPPSIEALTVMLNNTKLTENVFEDALDVLGTISDAPQNQEWLVKETERWARDRAMHSAIMKAVSVYDGSEKEIAMGDLPALMQAALDVSFDTYLGHIYWEMAGEHYDLQHEEGNRIPFDVDVFNRATRGGVGKKTLNLLTAAINAGKTTGLIHLAAMYAEQGLNVYVVTLEVAENVWRHRLDARMTRMPFERVEAMTKDEYLGYISKARGEGASLKGDIVIKEFASGSAHVGHFRHNLKELETKLGFIPDIIIIDYLGEALSQRLPAHLMANTNVYYTAVAREFRALGFEYDCPVWSALQFNREKQTSTDGGISDLADAIGIPKVADYIMAFYAPDELAAVKKARASVLKNRYANKQKLKSFLFGLDQDKQIMFDLDWDEVKADLTEEEAKYIQNVQVKHDKNKNGFNDKEIAASVNDWKF